MVCEWRVAEICVHPGEPEIMDCLCEEGKYHSVLQMDPAWEGERIHGEGKLKAETREGRGE